jgi:hypothetical protein
MTQKTSATHSWAVLGLVAAMAAGTLWGVAATEARVEQAVGQNVAAASLLSRLQVEGEKMRRYEKEMFIYVAVPEKRNGYVKEFDTAFTRLLGLSNDMLAPSSKAFTDAERGEIAKWKLAATFYGAEFNKLAQRAQGMNVAALTNEQRLGLTVSYNDDIKAGKDRFRELLTGTDTMRQAKETRSLALGDEMRSIFTQLRVGVLVGGLLAAALVILSVRNNKKQAAAGTARPQQRAASVG